MLGTSDQPECIMAVLGLVISFFGECVIARLACFLLVVSQAVGEPWRVLLSSRFLLGRWWPMSNQRGGFQVAIDVASLIRGRPHWLVAGDPPGATEG